MRLCDPVVPRAPDGRLPLRATVAHADVIATWAAGAVRVPADQAPGPLIAALLEPEAPGRRPFYLISPILCER